MAAKPLSDEELKQGFAWAEPARYGMSVDSALRLVATIEARNREIARLGEEVTNAIHPEFGWIWREDEIGGKLCQERDAAIQRAERMEKINATLSYYLMLEMCECPWPSDAMRTRHLLQCAAERKLQTILREAIAPVTSEPTGTADKSIPNEVVTPKKKMEK